MENHINPTPIVNSSISLQDIGDIAPQCNRSFSDSSSQLDQDKCYLMEIQQLKRQNNFLRKKLEENQKKKRFSIQAGPQKKGSFSLRNVGESSGEQSKHYIISFIDEIVKLLQNFSSLFSIDLQSSIESKLKMQNQALNELAVDQSQYLNRRLNKILLQPEQIKYKQLLDIFQQYFKDNTQRTRTIQQKVQILTTQAIELGKQMASTVKEREVNKRTLRGSQFFSSIKQSQQTKQGREDGGLKSSIIKSTCDQQYDLSGCKAALGKQKLFLNIF